MDERTAKFYGRDVCLPLLRTPGLEGFGRGCLLLSDGTYNAFEKSVGECLQSSTHNPQRTFPYSPEGVCAAKNIEKFIKESGFLHDPLLLQKAEDNLIRKLTSQPTKQEICRHALRDWGPESGEFCNRYIPDFYPRMVYTNLEKCKRQCGLDRGCIVDCTIDQMRLNKVFNALEKLDKIPLRLPPLSSPPRVTESFAYTDSNENMGVLVLVSFFLLGLAVWLCQKK